MRATTFLELKKRTYRMGVNSDDGFLVTSAVNPLDAAPLQLGIFNGVEVQRTPYSVSMWKPMASIRSPSFGGKAMAART